MAGNAHAAASLSWLALSSAGRPPSVVTFSLCSKWGGGERCSSQAIGDIEQGDFSSTPSECFIWTSTVQDFSVKKENRNK